MNICNDSNTRKPYLPRLQGRGACVCCPLEGGFQDPCRCQPMEARVPYAKWYSVCTEPHTFPCTF